MNPEEKAERIFSICRNERKRIDAFVNNRDFNEMTEQEKLHYIHHATRCVNLLNEAIALERNRKINITIVK